MKNTESKENHVNNLKKTIKQQYYIDLYGLIDNYSSNNNQDFWKLARKLTKSSHNISIPPLVDLQSGNIAISDQEKATFLNNYFVDISTIDDADDDTPPCPPRTHNSIELINIHETDIVDIIKTLNTNKASGLDEISHHMLKIPLYPCANLYWSCSICLYQVVLSLQNGSKLV